MPVTLTERLGSRRWTGVESDSPGVEIDYILAGTSDDGTAKTLVASSTPQTYDGLVRDGIDLEPVWVDTTRGDGQWNATVRYTSRPPTGESEFSFDTTGGTQHITQSLQTVGKYAPGSETPPDFKGAVGVTHDNVEGVDIQVPTYAFAETHYLPIGVVTPAYVGTVFNLTGKVNSAPFKGLAAGECLFLGARGQRRGTEEDWAIAFSFAGSPNRSNITVGDITGIAKKGWEYLWVRYADAKDDTAKRIVKKPIAAYVEKVYEEGNFAGLGMGT